MLVIPVPGARVIGAGLIIIGGIALACSSDSDSEEAKKEKNCRALYDATVQSCWSITDPRKRQRCFEAAKGNYEACMED